MPFRFLPITRGSSFEESLPVINGNFAQLDSESVTKTFNQPGGNSIVQGKLPYEGGYGSIYYDTDGTPRMILGILPDGTMGFVISKEGVDVLTVF